MMHTFRRPAVNHIRIARTRAHKKNKTEYLKRCLVFVHIGARHPENVSSADFDHRQATQPTQLPLTLDTTEEFFLVKVTFKKAQQDNRTLPLPVIFHDVQVSSSISSPEPAPSTSTREKSSLPGHCSRNRGNDVEEGGKILKNQNKYRYEHE